jgi:hypothetical protein
VSVKRSNEISNEIWANIVIYFTYINSSANKEFHIALQMIKAKMPEFYEKRRDFQDLLKSPSCFEELFGDNI